VADREGGCCLTESRRELVLSTIFAVWGLAIAIAMISVWNRPAPAGQLPGVATALNFDAHGPFRWIAGLILLPILLPLALRPVTRMLAAAEAWARNSAIAAVLFTLFLVTTYRRLGWALLPCAIVIAICVALRNRDLHFTRADGVLLPVFLTTYAGVMDALPWMDVNACVCVAALIVFVLRVAVALIPSPVPPALAFVFAPCALVLQTGFFARDQRYFGWPALAIVIVTPFLVRILKWNLRKALVFVVYPLAVYAYANAMSLATAEGKPRVNFFEDGHSLLPASEYLRGERPYRDVLPAHGLIEDGGFDYVAMRIGGIDAGTRWKARDTAGNLTSIALYALAFAATGSAEAALFATLLSILSGVYAMPIRLLVPFATLAFLAAAVRLRRPRLFAYAGFGTVLAGATSLDFGAYASITLIVALIRSHLSSRSVARDLGDGRHADRAIRPPRSLATLRDDKVAALIGIAAAAIPLFVALALFGILDDFFTGTFIDTLSAGPAYTLEFFTPPAAMKDINAFPDVFAAMLDRTVFPYLVWCALAIFAGVAIARRPRRSLEPVLLIAVFSIATAISYAERHHLYFRMTALVIVVYALLRLLRRRSVLAIPAILAAITLAAPSAHMGVTGWMRRSRGPIEPGWIEVRDVPRAKGAYFHESDARVLASVRRYLARSLKPDETFFDFTNSGILYFLTGRDCPIREYEVAFYESEARQREVIRRIESNPNVRAALIPASPQARFTVDGISNLDRAPLVWQYLQTHFTPDFQEGDVVFWRRR